MKHTYLHFAAALLLASSASTAFATYPEGGSFDGTYKFTPGQFTLVDDSYAEFLPEEIVFDIVSANGAINVMDFLVVSNGTEYDQATGILTLNTVYFKPAGAPANLGIAPTDGGWTGMAGLYANKMKWQIGEDGSITIPDFDIVTFNGSTATATIAEYRNGSVTPTEKKGGDEPGEEKSFEGTYPMKGYRYEYRAGEAPTTTEMDFDLVINANNQITSIGGYTLDRQQISDGRNKGQAKGDQLILFASTSNGVMWKAVPSGEDGTYMEAWLLGGPNIQEWSMLDDSNRIVFTLKDDGSYSLSPFTIWHRYQIVNEYKNTETVYELLFKWESNNPGDVTAADTIEAPAGETHYFNLSGIEMKNPVAGQVVIMVKDGKASKIMLK